MYEYWGFPDGWAFFRVTVTNTTSTTTSTPLPDPHAEDFAAWETELDD